MKPPTKPRRKRKVPEYDLYSCQKCGSLHAFTKEEIKPVCECGGEFKIIQNGPEDLPIS